MKPSFVVLMTLITCSLIYPQETKNSKYALSFGIADNFRLDRFNLDIAVKKIIDENHQLRLFLSPRISSNKQEEKTSGSNQNREAESLNYSLGIGADYLWILLNSEGINMFSGTGLIFSFGNNDNREITTIFEDGTKTIEKISTPYTSIGVRGTLGVEWKVTNNIGIHSEYLFTGSYNWSKSEIKNSFNGVDNPTRTITSSTITLGSGVLFGVSIYL